MRCLAFTAFGSSNTTGALSKNSRRHVANWFGLISFAAAISPIVRSSRNTSSTSFTLYPLVNCRFLLIVVNLPSFFR